MQKLTTLVLTLFCSTAVMATESLHCLSVLEKGGLFANQSARELAESERFLTWQCATAYRKHKHALAAGLAEGTLLYGTPLKQGGKWKNAEVEAWKDDNCSVRARKRDVDAATFKYVRRQAPELLSDWASCMSEQSSTAELACEIKQVGNLSIFGASFRGAVADDDGSDEPDSTATMKEDGTATVSSWQVAGGTCYPALQPGTRISEQKVDTSCAADTNANLVVMLETDKGKCWQTAAQDASILVIDGRTELQEKTTFEADVIEFTPTAEVITNGFDLIITAKKRLHIRGLPKITSFVSEDNRAPGSDGRNAAPIIIKTAEVEGSKLLIFNHGEHGTPGLQGADGRKGARGSPGRAGSDRGMKGCVGRKSGGKGRTGGRGKPGGAGGDAGDGGSVTIELKNKQFSGGYDRFIISQARVNPFTNEEYRCEGTCPGAAGPGGAGGKGGEGGRGGAGVRGSWPCGGVSPGHKGKQGAPGRTGKSGKAGQPGSILIL